MNRQKEPLYRKTNYNSLSEHYHTSRGGEFRHQRHTKKQKNFDGNFQSMPKRTKVQMTDNGLDFNPLYRFLASKVGGDWNEIYSEICSRLPVEFRKEIWYIVAEHVDIVDGLVYSKGHEGYYFGNIPYDPVVRIGENRYYDRLFIDENNVLKKVKDYNYEKIQ